MGDAWDRPSALADPDRGRRCAMTGNSSATDRGCRGFCTGKGRGKDRNSGKSTRETQFADAGRCVRVQDGSLGWTCGADTSRCVGLCFTGGSMVVPWAHADSPCGTEEVRYAQCCVDWRGELTWICWQPDTPGDGTSVAVDSVSC